MLTGMRALPGRGRRAMAVRPRRPDDGITVVELAVTMIVTALLLATVVTAMTSIAGAYRKVQDTTMANDRGRVILDRFDRDLRQASAINVPQTVGGSAYVEYETDVARAGAAPTCTQWRLDGSAHVLAVRTWTLPAPAAAPAWQTVATGVVNDVAAQPPFALPSAGAGSGAGAGMQREQLTVQLRLALPKGQALTRGTVTARNSSASGGASTDADGDGLPDAPVCLTFGRS